MVLLSFREEKYVQAIGLLSFVCVAFFVIRVAVTGTSRFWFVPENLALAWLSLIFAFLLVRNLKTQRWSSWLSIFLSFLWLFFLPNAWYVLTDFIHVTATNEISELYDIVMISLLVICGFTLGFTGLYLVHQEFRKRFTPFASNFTVLVILFLSSFAIYLGRDLRWNSWDVIANPGGIIFNVSDRILDPLGHSRSINVTGLFFILLSVLYIAIWILLAPSPGANRAKRR